MRWDKTGGLSFKEYSDVRVDCIKALGAGNATGLLSIAAFLSTAGKQAPIAASIALTAKICLSTFFVGVVAFALAFYYLCHWRMGLDAALSLFPKYNAIDDVVVADSIKEADYGFQRAGGYVLLSILCMTLGSTISLLGVLLFY
jgi:hypothetical protein